VIGTRAQLSAACALLAFGCSEAELFGPGGSSAEADRVAFTGQVCARDPISNELPLRVVIVGDRTGGPLFASFDPAAQRVQLLGSYVSSALASSQLTEFAVVGFAGRSRKLAPIEGNFTRNPGELLNGINQLSLPEPCEVGGQCRDYLEGLRTARALIEGDLAEAEAGRAVVTQYLIVLVVGGPQDPLARNVDCCDSSDAGCLDQTPSPDAACQAQREQQEVAALKEAVAAQGALGVKLHVVHFAADLDMNVNMGVQDAMRSLAFSGTGSYQRYDNQAAFNPAAFDVLRERTSLRAKALFVANVNAKPTLDGAAVDSDADGLSDAEEDEIGTLPTNPDTDGDGLSDFIESVVEFDPHTPDMPAACMGVDPAADSDLDGLNDCEEALLGTEPTLADTDGDGVPDQLELYGFTDYLEPDAEQDSDGDGVSNADEVLQHTDARSTDSSIHLSYGYRYDVSDEGIVRELFAPPLKLLTGVEVLSTSEGTTPGLGVMRYDAAAQTLQWQDAMDGGCGSPPCLGPPIDLSEDGEQELWSSSYSPLQGDDGRLVVVRIDAAGLPPDDVTENVRILYRERQCLNYTVRNVRLMDTLALDDGTEAGRNRVVLFFAETPEGRITSPGPFRIAEIPIIFRPPGTRIPKAPRLQVLDEEFVRPR